FWGLCIGVGSLIPLVLLCIALLVSGEASHALRGFAGLFALAGLFAYEHCFVVAGQSVPLS
ncbi:MAG: 4Fe-4S ferredoxin, partial [Chloroflexota bacterium]|nr:4Fe-4S ferredoxin [Chloroflexota bacterium]